MFNTVFAIRVACDYYSSAVIEWSGDPRLVIIIIIIIISPSSSSSMIRTKQISVQFQEKSCQGLTAVGMRDDVNNKHMYTAARIDRQQVMMSRGA